MIRHFGDRLTAAISAKNAPACVGVDPVLTRLPEEVLQPTGARRDGHDAPHGEEDHQTAARAIVRFGREVIGLVAPHVAAVKINIAFFEPYRAEGVAAYYELVRAAHDAGLLVIGDIKRADIGHTSGQYAAAHLMGAGGSDGALPDAVTVNPYFGVDGVRPFLDAARDTGRGVFVLVQTSNESAREVQDLSVSDGAPLCHHVARLVQTWGEDAGMMGDGRYSCVGAVVSPRDVASSRRIRTLMPNCIFLVPGFGAQGRTAAEVANCFHADGGGAIVNASRSVLYAFADPHYREQSGDDWRACIEQACRDFVRSVQAVARTT